MRILYLVHQFYPIYYTGTEKVVLNLSSMFQKLGNQVKVMTYSFYEDSFYDRNIGNLFLKEFMYNGIPIVAFRNRRIPESINFTLDNKELAEIADKVVGRYNPDIVHVGHPMRVGGLIKALNPLGVPYIITLTDFFLICPRVFLYSSKNVLCAGPAGGDACKDLCSRFSKDFISRRLEIASNILFNAKRVVSPSIFLASVFKREFENLDLKIINHGLNFPAVRQRGRNKVEQDKTIFCYAGTLVPHKGVHVLINAFRKMSSGRAILKIYGSGTNEIYVNHLKNMAKGEKRIEFCGTFSASEVGEIFSKVDVVVVPSLCYESYSMVLHEALACNTPAIVSNAGGLAEKIIDGQNGFTFKLGDAEHLKKVLERAANRPEDLETLRINIRRQVIPVVEQEAYAYEREYRKILTKRNDG